MYIDLIAYTSLRWASLEPFKHKEIYSREMGHEQTISDGDLLSELAGRICYDSFHLPNTKTRTNRDYLDNIRYQKHFSVLEHASYTFFVSGVSRSLLCELSRHRHLSFSVRSQRYCNESNSKPVIPPIVDSLDDTVVQDNGYTLRGEFEEIFRISWQETQSQYVWMAKKLIEAGHKRKVAYDAARYLLPEATMTEMFVTGNGRAWLEVIEKRSSVAAAKEIQDFANAVHEKLKQVAPNTFG